MTDGTRISRMKFPGLTLEESACGGAQKILVDDRRDADDVDEVPQGALDVAVEGMLIDAGSIVSIPDA